MNGSPYKRIRSGSFVERQVGDDKNALVLQRRGADRLAERRFAGGNPLTTVGDQTDESDRGFANSGRKQRNIVKDKLRLCVQNAVTVRRSESPDFQR
jgi:hypothetical protein